MAQDIRTYAGLVAAVQAWLDSSEGALVDAIPNMIALAEADFRRNIVTPDMEVTVTIDPSLGSLPTDIDSVRLFTLTGMAQQPMTAVSPSDFYDLPVGITGTPRYYTTSNNALSIWPAPDMTYTAALIYRQAIPALTSANATNWLLTGHPDAYLFGTLLQAEFFGWTDERLPIIQTKLSAIIDDINSAGNRKRYGGPLIARAKVTDAVLRYA